MSCLCGVTSVAGDVNDVREAFLPVGGSSQHDQLSVAHLLCLCWIAEKNRTLVVDFGLMSLATEYTFR